MAKKNAFYAQSGGVTAVINASASGVIETARKNKDKIGKVYAGRNGIIGALTFRARLRGSSVGTRTGEEERMDETPAKERGRKRQMP